MRLLFLAHSFNSLTQRLYAELTQAGHEVSVEFDIGDRVTEEAAAMVEPDLVVAPFLKRAIPEAVWRRYRSIVIHPGIPGDRGPSALDRAILRGEREWGVTALEATGEMDAGDIWASATFPMREASKSSLYRNEVTEAAVRCMTETIEGIQRGRRPTPQGSRNGMRGRTWPLLGQAERAIDWQRDDTERILTKIRASDGSPGVLDQIAGVACYLYDAHRESGHCGAPGEVIAKRDGAICRATRDGAIWITHLRRANDASAFKLPAARVLGSQLDDVPELPLQAGAAADAATWREIFYEEAGDVGFLHFPFYNGAMGTAQCEALRRAYGHARSRPTRVIVLMGGPDFWSNGIHLNLIEAAAHPADESWKNIEAMDDLVRDIVETDGQLTIAALCGNAGAGGAFLALAADRVYARDGVILNPHYKSMGNLYGSEYWTYLLPLRVAPDDARRLVDSRLPIAAAAAARIGLVDEHFGCDVAAFRAHVERRARDLANDPQFGEMLEAKRRRRAADEARKPLAAFREQELARMRLNFYGFDSSYHVARHNFVRKVPRSRTPLYLARHRRLAAHSR